MAFLLRLGAGLLIFALLFFCFGNASVRWLYAHPDVPFVRGIFSARASNPVEAYEVLAWATFGRMLVFLLVGGLAAMPIGAEPRGVRMLRAALAVAGGLACERLLGQIISPYWWSWGGMRLAWDYAALHFRTPYPEAVGGPLLSTMYGPLGAFVFAPVAFQARPDVILTAATALNVAYFVFPIVLALAWGRWRGEWGGASLTVGMLAAVFCVFVSGALVDSAFCIHVDAPALCLSGVAAVLLVYAPERRGAVAAGAIAALLAVAVKQTFFPVVVAGGVWLWIIRSTRRAFFLRTALVAAIVISAAVLIGVPWSGLYENFFFLPTHYPWKFSENILFGSFSVAGDLLRESALPLAVTLAAVMRLRREARGARLTDVAAFLLFAAALVPVSLLGRIKVGGDLNTLTPTVYFCVLAMTVALARAARLRAGELSRGAVVATLLVVIVWAPQVFRGPNWGKIVHARENSLSVRAYDYLKSGARDVYFPFDPLAHILVEGTFYHAYYGVLDRAGAGVDVTPAQFLAGVPAGFSRLALPSWTDPKTRFLEWTPGVVRADDPALPGFQVYRRSP